MRRPLPVVIAICAAAVLIGGLIRAGGSFAATDNPLPLTHGSMSQPLQGSAPGGASAPGAAGTSVTTTGTPSAATKAPNTGTGDSGSGTPMFLWLTLAGVTIVAAALVSAGWLTARRKN